MLPKISLEQWATFKAVVDEGSFAKAAEALNKSQSTVSYTLAKLEERLPGPVLEVRGRKAEMTPLGEVLYRHAGNLLQQAILLDDMADYLARGWEAEVTIAVDALVPIEYVLEGVQTYSANNPLTRIRLLETTLSGTDEALLFREADIVLTPNVPPGFLGRKYCTADFVVVASPAHPLAEKDEVTENDLCQHRQIVIRDSGRKRQQDVGWLRSEQRWTVTYLSTSIESIKRGLGFGFLPKDRIQRELSDGTLAILPVVPAFSRVASVSLVLADQSGAGPATKALSDALLAAVNP